MVEDRGSQDETAGQDTTRILDEDESRRVARNLKKLEALRDLMGSLGPDAAGEESEVTNGQWGHLTLKDRLGAGCFGDVYRAYDPLLQRDVALKLRRREAVDSDNELYINEARRMAQVHHPSVLAIHGAGINDGRVGLWADLINGETLQDLLQTEGNFDRSTLMTLLTQLNDALRHVHEVGLVHGDVKLDNVMRRDGRFVLMDFGAAEHDGMRPRFGSPAYMAPELFDENGKLTPKADLYSLGILALGAATGEQIPKPKMLNDPELRAELGSDLHAILLGLLERDTANRLDHDGLDEALALIRDAPARRRRRLIFAVIVASLSVGLLLSLFALNRVERERQRLELVKDLVVESVQQLSPEGSSGPEVMQALFENIGELTAERLSDYPDARADMQLIAGEGLQAYGERGSGLALAEQALTTMLVEGRSVRDLAHTHNIVARMRNAAGDFGGAEAAIRRSVALFETLPAAQFEKPDEGPLGVIQGRTLLANLLARQGDLRGRLEAHRLILQDREALLGVGQPGSAVDYHNVAQSLLALGFTPDAVASEEGALALLGQEDLGTFKELLVQLGLARAYGEHGQHKEAQTTLTRTRELFQRLLPEGHRLYASLDEASARLAYLRGNRDIALATYRAHFADAGPGAGTASGRTWLQYAETERLVGNSGAFEQALAKGQEQLTDEYGVLRPVFALGTQVATSLTGRATLTRDELAVAIDELAEQLRTDYPQLPELALLYAWREAI
ncbi:MAG: serine/threonine-protein kinase [Pseudomonadota bacterium]